MTLSEEPEVSKRYEITNYDADMEQVSWMGYEQSKYWDDLRRLRREEYFRICCELSMEKGRV